VVFFPFPFVRCKRDRQTRKDNLASNSSSA
jgi:hypothetical protein